jgi:primosomal protein N' (replication factor Y)
MSYAEVAVNLPLRQSFYYSFPSSLDILPGQMAAVPWGDRIISSIILQLTDLSPVEQTKDVAYVISPRPLLAPSQLELARWMSAYYLSPLFKALSLMLPPGWKEKGVMEPPPKLVPYLRLNPNASEVDLGRKAPRQNIVLQFLSHNGSVPLHLVRQHTHCSAKLIQTLKAKGLVEEELVEEKDLSSISPLPPLNPVEENTWHCIKESLSKGKVFLLYGEGDRRKLYAWAFKEIFDQGKRGIYLVPRISRALCPELPVSWISFHSRLSLKERLWRWWRVQKGEIGVVVGTNSTLFTPQSKVGLIVVDEEQDGSYKQVQSPRYHAREVALKWAELCGASVILGSTTPDAGTFYHAQAGEFISLELPSPILPKVEIVDMHRELRSGNRSILSHPLQEEIRRVLDKGEQAILFLNRRGMFTLAQCWDCGWTMTCPHCDLPLVYHQEGKLLCHSCHYEIMPPSHCPQCGGIIKLFGMGTQRIREEAQRIFPEAEVLRFDLDTLSQKDVLRSFFSQKADILVGTQLIISREAFPSLVSVVGVVLADTALNLPDFRASEHTLQLLTQVALLAREKVIIQTYASQSHAFKVFSYSSFYAQEIEWRRRLHAPPFSQMVRLVYSHRHRDECEKQAQKFYSALTAKAGPEVSILPPSPAFRERWKKRYHWQVILRGRDPSSLIADISLPRGWMVDVDPVSFT